MKSVVLCTITLFTTCFSLPNSQQREEIHTSSISHKIYGMTGAKLADIKRYPYAVSMMNDAEDLILGSGAILNKQWIVCSALQVADSRPDNITVRVGSNHADVDGQHLNVSKIIIHDKYNGSYQYNVALIKTASNIKLENTVKPIKLAKSAPKAGMKSMIVGYGMDMSGSNLRNGRLQVTKIKVSSQSVCTTQYGNLGDTCFCAEFGDSSPCYNDVGDPLVRNKQLVGIYIGGVSCVAYNLTEVYTNVAALRRWILNTIKENSVTNDMEHTVYSRHYKVYGLMALRNNRDGRNDDNDVTDDDGDRVGGSDVKADDDEEEEEEAEEEEEQQQQNEEEEEEEEKEEEQQQQKNEEEEKEEEEEEQQQQQNEEKEEQQRKDDDNDEGEEEEQQKNDDDDDDDDADDDDDGDDDDDDDDDNDDDDDGDDDDDNDDDACEEDGTININVHIMD